MLVSVGPVGKILIVRVSPFDKYILRKLNLGWLVGEQVLRDPKANCQFVCPPNNITYSGMMNTLIRITTTVQLTKLPVCIQQMLLSHQLQPRVHKRSAHWDNRVSNKPENVVRFFVLLSK